MLIYSNNMCSNTLSHNIPLESWSGSVHLIMNYYRNLGVPVPKILFSAPTETIVEYIDGYSLDMQKDINENQIYLVFSLIKQMHSNALKLGWTKSLVFQDNYIRTIGGSKILSHCDITPENVIFKGDSLTGIIDWELAGPINPLVEFCKSCWLFSKYTSSREQSILYMMDIYGLKLSQKRYIYNTIKSIIVESLKQIPTIKKNQKAIEWRKNDIVWFDNILNKLNGDTDSL